MEDFGADSLPVGVVRLDDAGRIIHANAWFGMWAGSSPDEIVGQRLEELLVPADGDFFPDGVGPGPWVMQHAHDRERAAMVARSAHDGGELLILTEASERFHALTDLRHRHALADRTRTRLQLVMDSSVAFATATTERRLAEILADTTQRAYRAEESTVYLRGADGAARVAAGSDPLAGRIDVEALITAVTDPRRVMKVVGDPEGEAALPGLGAAMRAEGVRALIAAPLHHEDAEFGAFVSWFHHERSFDDEAAPLAEALAGQAAQALATLRLQARLAHAATHDEVTGLPNRRLLEVQMDEIIGTTCCAVLFIDLDGFKRVNDRLGHQAGDRMLRDVAERLLSGVRADDVVARYGGDEFIIACTVSQPSDALEMAERILGLLRGDPTHPLRSALRASIGVAIAERGSELVGDQLIRRADLAMYRAKSAGGDRIVLADD